MNKVFLTKQSFFELDECKCGKQPFRYHNTSSNVFTAKCNSTKHEYDLKTKKWINSKKQPCDLLCEYHDTRPVFQQINKVILKSVVVPDKDKALEEKLKLLFRFVFVSSHTSTLDEINILVKNNLKREPRKIYYFPSIGHMRISHYETLEDYHNRIFSKKIIDLTDPPLKQKEMKRKEKKASFISRFIVGSCESECESVPVEPEIVVSKKKITEKKIPFSSKFIVVSDDDESEEEPEDESDRDSESERELSDYEDKENEEEIFSEEENYDEEEPEEYGDYD